MKAMIGLLSLCSAAIAGCATQAPVTGARLDAFIERAESCGHWAGEDGYDADRAAEIGRALEGLDCDTVVEDGNRLRRRYADDPRSLARLDEALSVFF